MADRICDNCMSRVPIGSTRCPKCGIRFENTNPGGALPNGWVLGERYTIGRYIDIDGEGVTYSAIDASTLQRVIIKEYMPVTLCATRDERGQIVTKPNCEVLFKTTRMDFGELYRTLMGIGLAEGLVQVLDVVDENETTYAVLEKIEGPTLTEYLMKSGEPLDSARAMSILRPVFMGVEALHAANVIHRGISLDNIILESGGTAKLSGYATLALRQQGSELKPKMYPGYSAPEQYSPSEFEGRYTDVYALGAVLYRMVTGNAPQPADERKIQDNLRAARAENKAVPAYVSSAIARAMRINPNERVQSVQDLRVELTGEVKRSGGRGGKGGRGGFNLTRQQKIIGGIALGAVALLLVVVLIIAMLTSPKRIGDASSVANSSSESVVESQVPNLLGKVYTEVLSDPNYKSFKIELAGEEYSTEYEAGRIMKQTPDPGQPADTGTVIRVTVSKGVEPVEMPDFTARSYTEAEARNALAELKVTADNITVTIVVNDGTMTEGMVVRTDPAAGTKFDPTKQKIILYVAGPKQAAEPTVPDVTGMKLSDARQALENAGYIVAEETVVNTDPAKVGRVASTNPSPNTKLAKGSRVTVYVYGAVAETPASSTSTD